MNKLSKTNKKIGRPPKDSCALNIRISRDVLESLSQFCEDVGATKTSIVEKAVREYVDNHEDVARLMRGD